MLPILLKAILANARADIDESIVGLPLQVNNTIFIYITSILNATEVPLNRS